MRLSRATTCTLAIPLLVASIVHTQEKPQVDLKDPAAVALAYANACRAGDGEAALALIAPDDPSLPRLREMLAQMKQSGGAVPPMEGLLADYLLLPVGVKLDRELVGTTQEGDQATVKLKATATVAHSVALARQPDGTWRVKLIASLEASAPGGKSSVAGYFTQQPQQPRGPEEASQGPQGRGQDVWPSENNLRQLMGAVTQYATDHDGQLPHAERWVDDLEPYVLDRSAFRCPARPELEYGYAMNSDLSGKALGNDWEARRGMVVLFEWPGGERNARASAGEASRLKSLRADGTIAMATADTRTFVLRPGTTLAQKLEAERTANTCADHLRRLVGAARKYARDHGGLLPRAESWQEDLAPYARPGQVAGGGGADDRQSRNRLGQLYRALEEYGRDHDGKLPVADRWMDELQPYVMERSPFKCPAMPDLDYGYAMNDEVSGKALGEDWGVRSRTLLLFEWASGERNAHATPAHLAAAGSPRGGGRTVVLAANGNATTLPVGATFADVTEAERLGNECSDHLRKLAGAARKYAREHGGILPGADSWLADLAPYLAAAGDPELLLRCPAAPDLDYAYAINRDVAGKNAAQISDHDRTILFFESDLNVPNATGLPGWPPQGPCRHMAAWSDSGSRFDYLAYLSGSVEVGPTGGRGDGQPGALDTLLTCPAAPNLKYAYAINREVAGKKATELTAHDQIVLFFESDLNVPNAAGLPDKDGPAAPRHLASWGDQERGFSFTGRLNGDVVQGPVTPVPATGGR